MSKSRQRPHHSTFVWLLGETMCKGLCNFPLLKHRTKIKNSNDFKHRQNDVEVANKLINDTRIKLCNNVRRACRLHKTHQ